MSSSSSSHPIVLTSSPDGPITAFDAVSGVPLCHFSGSRSPPHGLALVGDSFIAASHVSPETASASIHLYNWWSSTPLHNLLVPEPVAPLSSTSDGLYLFAGGLSGCIYTLSVPSGDILTTYPAHNKPVSCLKISEDESVLISGGDDGTISFVPTFQIVDASPDKSSADLMLQRFVAHDGSVTSIEYSSNTTILSCSLDGTVKIWELLDGSKLRTVTFPCPITGMALDQTRKQIFAAGCDGFIYKVERQKHDDELMSRFGEKHESGIVCLVMMVMGERKSLASASEDGKVRIWETETGEAMMRLGNDDEIGSNVSYMVVANGIGRQQGLKIGKKSAENFGDEKGGLSRLVEVSRTLRESMELEDAVRVAAKDRSRAIYMLESAISMYERLLELILKEAKKARGSNKSGTLV